MHRSKQELSWKLHRPSNANNN